MIMGHYQEKQYSTKKPDKNGFVQYTEEEHAVWSYLYKRQIETIKNRGCIEFKEGLKKLELSPSEIPQASHINTQLEKFTGWNVEMVPAVIPAEDFFQLLSQKKFPMATFIRTQEQIDYLQEPDIFHEVFGHCPLLTLPSYANFVENYGKLALSATKKQRKYLFRLFWFSIEFGLIKRKNAFEIYGGGILSSYQETIYALEKEKYDLDYLPFNELAMMKTPFRIDQIQPLYYYIESFDDLFKAINKDLINIVDQAIEQGDLVPRKAFVNPEGEKLKYTN
jgi:phenylalanine-4-hydroxylase